MNNNDLSWQTDEMPTKEYDAHEVAKQNRSHAALLSQTTALIGMTIYLFFMFLPESNLLKVFEMIVSGIILAFSTLAVLFVFCQSWKNTNNLLRLSLMFLLIITFGAFFLDALNPLSRVMFDVSLSHMVSKFARIVVLMLMPISLFPALFLNNDEIHKLNVRALWFFTITVIPLLLLRILGISTFIS